jgi:exodeoxyribonuclease VIII
MPHVMIDLETMGKGPKSAIISIGAVEFSGEKILKEFEAIVSLESSMKFGGVVDASTVAWWMSQSDAARAKVSEGGLDLRTALGDLWAWMPKGNFLSGVWGNGATFDNVIIRSAFEATFGECPWEFWKDRCYRTIFALAGKKEEKILPALAHSAVEDAKAQAQTLINVCGRRGISL